MINGQEVLDVDMTFSRSYDQSNRYIILLITRLGLANRLRALADWHQIGSSSLYKV